LNLRHVSNLFFEIWFGRKKLWRFKFFFCMRG
jgi:hypothetical protein